MSRTSIVYFADQSQSKVACCIITSVKWTCENFYGQLSLLYDADSTQLNSTAPPGYQTTHGLCTTTYV